MCYLLLSCGLALAVTMLIFTPLFVLGPGYAEHANTTEEVLDALIVPLALIVLPIFLWGDVYAPERWQDDALFAPEVKAAINGCSLGAGPT